MKAIFALSIIFLASPIAAAELKIAKELEPFAFLAGSCWEGPFPDGKSVDSHCFKWFQKGRYLRERHEVKGSKPPYGGETTYYWDHEAKTVKYIYWTNTGGYSTGSARAENGSLKFPDERYVDAKEITSIHAEIRQVDSDTYTMTSDMTGKGGKTVPMQNATYKRKPLNW